jgi:uncharacterized membrane protein
LSGEYTSSYSQTGALKAFGCIMAGTIEVIPKGTDLSHVDDCLQRGLDAIQHFILETIDFELAELLVESCTRIFDMLLSKVEKDNLNITDFKKYEIQFFRLISTSFGIFNTHSLFSKESSEHNTELKKTCIDLFSKLSKLISIASSSTSTPSVLEKWLPAAFYLI